MVFSPLVAEGLRKKQRQHQQEKDSKLKEEASRQKNTKDSEEEEVEIVFIPTYKPEKSEKEQPTNLPEEPGSETSTIRFLTGKEFGQLQKKRRGFLSKSKSFQQEHSHNWEKIFMWHPGAGLLNAQAYNACFGCGEMVRIPIDKNLDEEISRIQSALVGEFNKRTGQKDGTES